MWDPISHLRMAMSASMTLCWLLREGSRSTRIRALMDTVGKYSSLHKGEGREGEG